MNLFTWISTPGNGKVYRNWIENPITRIMLEGLRELNRTARLAEPTGEKALQELGFRAARDSDLHILEHLDDYLEEPGGRDEVVEMRVKYLTDAEGYSEGEARKIVEEGQLEEQGER